MDQRSFDRLARLLGGATDRRAGLKAAFGVLLGAGGAAAAVDVDAAAKRRGKADETAAGKRKRKTCKPVCTGGFVCEKVGKKRECVCPTGVICDGACCTAGETCENGACVPEPQPPACRAFGAACKNMGRRCCAGLTCASGQDGSYPVACYRAKGAACASTAECPFGMSCTNGACFGNPVPDNPPPDGCASDGQPCSGGTGCCEGLACQDGACSADACTVTNLALGDACCTSNQCASGLCWYPQTTDGEPDGVQKECVVATGGACDYDTSAYSPCGLGNECDYDNDVCIGGEYYPLSVPTGGTGCGDTVPCFSSSDYCNAGTCTPRTPRQLKEQCDPAADLCPSQTKCTTYPVGSGASNTTTTYCLGNPFYLASSVNAVDECASYRVYNGGSGNRCTEICNVYLTSGTADTDVARGVALKNALEASASQPFKFFYVEPDSGNVKKYQTQQITLNFAAGGGMNMQACYGGTQGLRYTVSGNDANRIFDITTAAIVRISQCVLENGKATAAGADTGSGGAIRIDSSTLSSITSSEVSIEDCTIRNSSADGNGGGIASNGKLSLSGGVTITGCTAGGAGGGWYAQTGDNQPASMANTVSITGNAASASAQGAGVFWEGTQFRQSTSNSDYGAGMQCSVGSAITIATNTGATFNCAYGTTTPTWAFCACATAECPGGQTWNPGTKECAA